VFKREHAEGLPGPEFTGNRAWSRGPGFAARHIMTYRPACVALVWLLVLASGCSSPASPTDVEDAGAVAPAASDMAILTNEERAQAGLRPFKTSQPLMQAAQLHASQMASTGQMAHVIPGARYPEPQDRLSAVGYRWQAYAENVAYGQGSPASAVAAWMGSSGHRANILNPALTEIGTAVARGSDGRPYYVQVFGNPR
jgi:uncharacterized protein YkwD